QQALQSAERANSKTILRVQVNCSLVFAKRGKPIASRLVNAPEVEMRIKIALVSFGVLGALKPSYCAAIVALLYQISADIVIRVAKVGVNLDGLMTFVDRLVQHPHEVVGPSQERVRLGSRISLDRPLIERDCFVKVSLLLSFVGLLKMP